MNWSDPGLISLCLNPLRCRGGWVGGAWGGGSTSWVRPATLKMWLQVIDWIILCRRYLSLRHYLAQPPEEISISPPPKRLATGESRSFGGHRQTPPSLPVPFPFRHFDLLFFTHTWISEFMHSEGHQCVQFVNKAPVYCSTGSNLSQSCAKCHHACLNMTYPRRSKCYGVKTCSLFSPPLFLFALKSLSNHRIDFYLHFLASFWSIMWPSAPHAYLFIFPSSLQTPKTDGANQCLTPRFNLGMSLASAH